MHFCPDNCVAIRSAVVYYARVAHIASAGIKCWHCRCAHLEKVHKKWILGIQSYPKLTSIKNAFVQIVTVLFQIFKRDLTMKVYAMFDEILTVGYF